ncbi:MAG TPA: hypothetical protein VGT78_09830 [Rhizomicrobium sp.]|nr:hypothetical protein [Rhizomicrobium sp.]
MTSAKARHVFAGMRGGDLTKRVRALIALEGHPPEVCADFESCAAQLVIIGTIRDYLVHREVTYEKGNLKISNEFSAKSTETYVEITVGIDDLSAMKLDCFSIFIRLIYLNTIPKSEAARLALASAHVPWRYIPPQQGTPNRQRKARVRKEPQRLPNA